MQKYQNNYAGPTGIAIAGATVTVTKSDGTPATIYSDNGVTPITSLVTARDGEFAFYAANETYTITLRKFGLKDEVVTGILLYDPMDGGADTLGFQPAGSGAVARNVQDKLREVVSVFDFMTAAQVNNCWLRIGSLDVTDAIQIALNSVAGGRRTLHFPAGVYSVIGGIVGPRDVIVTGDGWQSTIKLANGANSPYIIKFGDETNVTTIELHDIAFDGNKDGNPSSGDGLVIVRGYKANLFNVRVTNCRDDGVQYEAAASCFENYIYGLSSYANDGYGLRMTGAGVTDTHIIGGDIGYNAAGGVVLATSCSVVDATIWGGGQPNSVGVVTAGLSYQIINCKIEGHGRHGVQVNAGGHFGFISGNKIYANAFTLANSGAYDGVSIAAGANFGTLTGNKIYSSVSTGSPYVMRYAVNFAGAHDSWTIAGNDMILLGVGIPANTVIVNGILATDKSDNNWIRTNIQARRSASVAATAAFAWTVFPFDLKDADTLVEFNSGTFTPKNSGRYRIEAAYTCNPSAAGENLGLALYTNAGVAIRRLDLIRSVGTGFEMVSGGIDEFLQAGVAYDLRYLVGSTSTQFLAGGEFTFARIRAVSN